MEYNKLDFVKSNDKKVLHKVKKHWVVISMALLMAIGGKAAMTQVNAQADSNEGPVNIDNVLRDRINRDLIQSHHQLQGQTNPNQTNNERIKDQNSNRKIVKQAATLHKRILLNAGINSLKSTSDKQNQHSNNQTTNHSSYQAHNSNYTSKQMNINQAGLQAFLKQRHIKPDHQIPFGSHFKAQSNESNVPRISKRGQNLASDTAKSSSKVNPVVGTGRKEIVHPYQVGDQYGSWYGTSCVWHSDSHTLEFTSGTIDGSDYGAATSDGLRTYNLHGNAPDWNNWYNVSLNGGIPMPTNPNYGYYMPNGRGGTIFVNCNNNSPYTNPNYSGPDGPGDWGGAFVGSYGWDIDNHTPFKIPVSDIQNIIIDSGVTMEGNLKTCFAQCPNVKSIYFNGNASDLVDTGGSASGTSGEGMFESDYNLSDLTFGPNFNMRNVQNESEMFGKTGQDTHLKSIIIQSPDTVFNSSIDLPNNWYQVHSDGQTDNFTTNLTDGNSHVGSWVTTPGERPYIPPTVHVSDQINYHYNGQQIYQNGQLSHYKYSGTSGDNVTITNSDDLPQGFQLSGNGTSDIKLDGEPHTVDLVPIHESDTITYEYNGTPEGNHTFSGNNYLASPASDRWFFISDNSHPGLNSNFRVNSTQKFYFDGKSHTAAVVPITANDTINYYYGSKPINSAPISGPYSKLVTAGTGLHYGYQLKDDGSQTFRLDNGPHTVQVVPSTMHDTINYYAGGNYEGRTTQDGTYDTAGVADGSNMPYGYHMSNDGTQNFTYNGGSHTVHVAPSNMTDTIDYEYNNHHEGSTTQNGIYGTNGTAGGANMPSGYRMSNDGTQNFTYNGQHHAVDVTPIRVSDTIDYVLSGSTTPLSSHKFQGNDVNAAGASDRYLTVGSNPDGEPNHYHVVNPNQQIPYTGQSTPYYVEVAPDQVQERIDYNYTDSRLNKVRVKTGAYNTSDSINDTDSDVLPGWHINAPGDTVNFKYDLGTVNVSVVPNTVSVMVEYQGTLHDHSQVTGFNGKAEQRVSLASWVHNHVPQGYHLDKSVSDNALNNYIVGSNGFTGPHDDETNAVPVKVDPDNVRVPITLADASNHSQVVMKIYASDLFTVGATGTLTFNDLSVDDQLATKGFSSLDINNNYNYTVAPSDVNAAGRFDDTEAYHKRPVLYVDSVSEDIPIQFKVGYRKVGGVVNFGIKGDTGSSVDIVDHVTAPQGYDIAPGQNALRTFHVDPNNLPSISNPAVVQLSPHHERLHTEFVDASDINQVIGGGYLESDLSDTIGSTVNLLEGFQAPAGYYLSNHQDYNRHYSYNSGLHALNYTLAPSDIQTDGNPGDMKMLKIYLTPVKSGIPVEYIGVDMDQIYNTGQSGPNGSKVNIENKVTSNVPKGYHIDPSVTMDQLRNYQVGSTGYSGGYLNPLTIKVDRNLENVPVHFLDQNGHPVGTTQYVEGKVNGDAVQLPTTPKEGNTPIHGYTFDAGDTLYHITPSEVEYDGNPGTTYPVPLTLVGNTGAKVPVIYKTLQNVALNSRPYDVTGQVGSDVSLIGGIPSGYTLVGGQNMVDAMDYLIKGQNLTAASGYTQTNPKIVYVTTNQQPLTINYIDPKNHFFLYSRQIPNVKVGSRVYLDKDTITNPASNSYLDDYTTKYKYGDYNDLRGYKLASDGYYGTHQNLSPVTALQDDGAYPAYNVYMEGLPVTVRVTYEDPNNNNAAISSDDITKNINGSDATTGDTVKLPVQDNANQKYNLKQGYTLDKGQVSDYQIRAADTSATAITHAIKHVPLLATGNVVHAKAPVTVVNIDSAGRKQGVHQIEIPVDGHVGDHLDLNSLEFKGYIPQGYELARQSNKYNHTEYNDNGRGHDYRAILTPSDSVSDSPRDGYTKWDSNGSWQNLSGGYWDSANHRPMVVIQAKPSNSNTITIHFVNQNGQIVGQTPSQRGDLGDSLGIGPNDWIIKDNMPQGYHYDSQNNFQTHVNYTGTPQNLDVMVAGNQVSATVPVTLHLKDADGQESTRQISIHDSNQEVGSVQNYYGPDYTPSSPESGSGYTLDTSGHHPYLMRIRMNSDGHYTILDNVDQNGNSIPNAENGTGQFWYQITNNVSAPLTVYYLDQHGHQIGCPVKIQGTIGHSVNVTNTKDGGEPLPKGYTLKGGVTQNGRGSDSDVKGNSQDTVYQLHHQSQTVYLRMVGNASASVPITVYQVVENQNGQTTVKTLSRDLVKDHPGGVSNGDVIEMSPSDYNPDSGRYSVDYSRSSNQFTRVGFDQNTKQSFATPQTFVFYYRSRATSGAPIMVRYIDDQTGAQVGDTQFLDGNLDNKAAVTDPQAPNGDISGRSVPFGYHLDTNSSQFPTDNLVNGNRKVPVYQFTNSPQNLNLPVQGNSDSATFHLHVVKEDAQGSLQGQIADVPVTVSGSIGQSFNVNPYHFSTGGVIADLPGGQFTAPHGYHATNSDADLQIRINSDGRLSPEDNVFYTYQQNYEPQQVGTVRIHYIDGNISDINPSNVNTDGSPKDEHEVDAVSDKGIMGNDFDLAPYRDDIPEALIADGDYQSTGKILKLHRNNNDPIADNNSGNQWSYSLNNNGFDDQGNCDVYIQIKKRGTNGADSGPIIIGSNN